MKFKITMILTLTLLLCFCASSEQKLKKEREKNPRYQYNVGIFYLNNGQLDQAVTYLNKALALKPGYDLALDGLGLVYFMQRDFEKSVSYFEKCIASSPKLTEAHNHLGSVYQEMGLLDKAEQEFRIAISDMTYQSRELPYYNLARLYFNRNKLDEALEYANNALNINNRLVLAHNLKGIIFENQEKFSAAITAYRDALDISGQDITLKYNLAGALFKNNEFVSAKALFEEIQSTPASEEMRANIEKYLEMLKKK